MQRRKAISIVGKLKQASQPCLQVIAPPLFLVLTPCPPGSSIWLHVFFFVQDIHQNLRQSVSPEPTKATPTRASTPPEADNVQLHLASESFWHATRYQPS